MSKPLTPKRIANQGIYGIIRPSEVDDALIPDGAVTEAVNVHFDSKGAVTVRPGLTGLGSTVSAGNPIYGIHNVQSATAIAVVTNGATGTSAIYSYGTSSAAGAWAMSLDGGTSSIRVRFVDFGSYSIALNFIYNTYTSMRFWDGGTRGGWQYTGNPINPQNMWGRSCQLGDVYKSRVYLGGDTSKEGNRSRLYFSSVISSTGIITFDPTGDYVDINPGDGEGMTGLKRFALELLVFKPNYIYRFKTTGVDPDPLIKVGTRSQESIIEGKRGLYFHHDSGFFRYTGDANPKEISRPISDIIAAIPYSQFDDIVAWNDGDHIYWSVGNLTITETSGTVTIKNAVLRYTESSEVWTVYSYPSNPTAGMTYNNQSSLTRLVGLDNGVVATHNVGVTDLGEPIKFRMRTKWFDFGSVSETKVINQLVAVCEKAQGSILMYQVNESRDWMTIKENGGTLTKMINVFDKLDLKFNRIRFLLVGASRIDAPIFREIEVLSGSNLGAQL